MIQEGDMVMAIRQEGDDTIYKVVVNHEEQYSIWPKYREIPKGWRAEGKSGLKADCLSHIKGIWTDMRPLSLRIKMKEIEAKRQELEIEYAKRIEQERRKPKDLRDDLVEFLSKGGHPLEVGLRPEKTVKLFKEAIIRKYVYVKFTDTRGGTELGFTLDDSLSSINHADFDKEIGSVHLEGYLILNYVRVKCVADIDLATLTGQGHLVLQDNRKECF